MHKVCRKYFPFLLGLLLFFSCRKGEEPTSWDADILTPLVKSSLSLRDLVTDSSLIRSDPDSSVVLVYDGDLYAFAVDSVLAIPDTTIDTSFYAPIKLFFNPGNAVMPPVNDETKYNLKGVELTVVRIKSGVSSIKITSHFNEPVIVNYKIPSATLSGVPFDIKIVVPAAPSGNTISVSQNYDLSGYEIDMKGSAGNKVNTIRTAITAILCDTCKGVDGDTVNVGEGLAIKNSFTGIVPAYARGYFGKNIFDVGPEEAAFDLFKSIKGGSLMLEKATLKLTIENGLGIDSRAVIKTLYSKNTSNGTLAALTSPYVNSSINIDQASETGNPSAPVIPSVKTIVLDNANSNVKSLLENLPDVMGYALRITTNPMGNVSGSNDFIYANNGLKTKLNIQVPLSLSANNITFMDTALTHFGDIKDKNKINYGKILMHITNGFPFDAEIQVFLLDDNLAITDSLIIGNTLALGAPADMTGKAFGNTFSVLEIPVNKEKLDRVFAAKKMLIRARLTTVNKPQLIKLYTANTMEVKLIGDFNYRVELK